MTIATLIGPSAWPLSQDDARGFVIIDDTDDDHMRALDQAIRAATEHAERYSGLTAARRTLQLRLDGWPDQLCNVLRLRRQGEQLQVPADIEVPAAPVRDVLSLTYVDPDGIEQTVDPASYSWERTTEGAAIIFESSFTTPDLRSNRKGVVRVTFECGFDAPDESGSGDDPDLKLPNALVMAIQQLVKLFYDNRAPVADAMKPAEALLDQVRVYR